MVAWNYTAILSGVAGVVPDRIAVISGEHSITFGELNARRIDLGKALWQVGVRPGDKVAINMLNRIEHLESFYGIQTSGGVPVNVNYRYAASELAYLFENSDAKVVLTEQAFIEQVVAAVERLNSNITVVCVDAPSNLDAVIGYEDFVALGAASSVNPEHEPNGDDVIFFYTGGTTGYPKAVMWRNEDVYLSQWKLNRPGKEAIDPAVAVAEGKRAATTLPASPIMHGTGFFAAMACLCGGGTVILLPSLRLDVDRIWQQVEEHRAVIVTIVGDVFARPLLESLDSHPEIDVSSLRVLSSSGARFTPELKREFLDRIPGLNIVDSLGATEAMITRSTVSKDQPEPDLGSFRVSDNVVVLGEDDEPVVWGSGDVGRIAVTGLLPLGYYKDPEKTARTWPMINGRRYSISGDMATVDADGRINFVGRGSACINTGGEKVYPDEVESAIKLHPRVADAAVLGVPDPRWGEAVTALVELTGDTAVTSEEISGLVRSELAPYKAPKHVLFISKVDRGPNGKIDYAAMKEVALAQLKTKASS